MHDRKGGLDFKVIVLMVGVCAAFFIILSAIIGGAFYLSDSSSHTDPRKVVMRQPMYQSYGRAAAPAGYGYKTPERKVYGASQNVKVSYEQEEVQAGGYQKYRDDSEDIEQISIEEEEIVEEEKSSIWDLLKALVGKKATIKAKTKIDIRGPKRGDCNICGL